MFTKLALETVKTSQLSELSVESIERKSWFDGNRFGQCKSMLGVGPFGTSNQFGNAFTSYRYKLTEALIALDVIRLEKCSLMLLLAQVQVPLDWHPLLRQSHAGMSQNGWPLARCQLAIVLTQLQSAHYQLGRHSNCLTSYVSLSPCVWLCVCVVHPKKKAIISMMR